MKTKKAIAIAVAVIVLAAIGVAAWLPFRGDAPGDRPMPPPPPPEAGIPEPPPPPPPVPEAPSEDEPADAPSAEAEAPQEAPKPPRRKMGFNGNPLGNMFESFSGGKGKAEPKSPEEVVAEFRKMLDGYRAASDEEREKARLGAMMVQAFLDGLPAKTEEFVKAMSPEELEKAVSDSDTALELIAVVEEEFNEEFDEDEAKVFGNTIQSLKKLAIFVNETAKGYLEE